MSRSVYNDAHYTCLAASPWCKLPWCGLNPYSNDVARRLLMLSHACYRCYCRQPSTKQMKIVAEIQQEAQTKEGVLYLTGTVIGSLAIVANILSLAERYQKRNKTDFFLTLTPLLLAVGFYLKLPYLYTKTLSKITLIVWGSCWLSIFILTLLCNARAEHDAPLAAHHHEPGFRRLHRLHGLPKQGCAPGGSQPPPP